MGSNGKPLLVKYNADENGNVLEILPDQAETSTTPSPLTTTTAKPPAADPPVDSGSNSNVMGSILKPQMFSLVRPQSNSNRPQINLVSIPGGHAFSITRPTSSLNVVSSGFFSHTKPNVEEHKPNPVSGSFFLIPAQQDYPAIQLGPQIEKSSQTHSDSVENSGGQSTFFIPSQLFDSNSNSIPIQLMPLFPQFRGKFNF